MSTAKVELRERIRAKKPPLSSAGLHSSRDEYTRTIAPARALAAEALTLERRLSAECGVPGGDCPDVANRPAPHADTARDLTHRAESQQD